MDVGDAQIIDVSFLGFPSEEVACDIRPVETEQLVVGVGHFSVISVYRGDLHLYAYLQILMWNLLQITRTEVDGIFLTQVLAEVYGHQRVVVVSLLK